MNTQGVKVRFAPSPTGFLHVGGLRTALFNYLFAKKNRGKFALRIEDTDQARKVEGAVSEITKALNQFGLKPDEGPYFQSERLEIYKKHAAFLLEQEAAYKCYCSEGRLNELRQQSAAAKIPFRYDKHCLLNPPSFNSSPPVGEEKRGGKFVIRQNVPEEGSTEFTDLVYGKIKVENRLLDDGILIKSDGWPVYNFANVVDDHEMGISHVIRGEEFISSTPKHILLYRALGWSPPEFAHLPLIVKPDRKKLSKRDNAADVLAYAEYFEIEAILNYIALLGWNPKTKQELFSVEELAQNFELEKINRANAVFDMDKFNWMNRQWILKKTLRKSQFYSYLTRKIIPVEFGQSPQATNREFVAAVISLVFERVKDFFDVRRTIKEEFAFFFEEPEYDPNLLRWKKMSARVLQNSLTMAKKIVAGLNTGNEADIQTVFYKEMGEQDRGAVLWPLRAALSGLRASPGPFEIIGAFAKLPEGKRIILARIQKALEKSQKL